MTTPTVESYVDHVVGVVTQHLDNDPFALEAVLVQVRVALGMDGFDDDPQRYTEHEWSETAGLAVRDYVVEDVFDRLRPNTNAHLLVLDLLDVKSRALWTEVGRHYFVKVREGV